MRRLFAFVGTALIALTLTCCNGEKEERFQGWIEADLIFVSPDEAGRIEELKPREGDAVATGDLLFTLDADLQEAEMSAANAALANAQQTFERAQQLLKTSAGTQKNLDDARAALREVESRVNTAKTRLKRRKVVSPASGVVQQIYFRAGEMVAASRAVLSLLPPGNVKVRFFVPQAVLPTIALGDRIAVSCDGCAPNLVARIDFLSRTAEYTPPVIYSLEERNKLVFMVEARPEQPEKLRVGQPVTVTRLPKEAPQ